MSPSKAAPIALAVIATLAAPTRVPAAPLPALPLGQPQPRGPAWLAPADLAPPVTMARAFQVAMAPNGDAVAVWLAGEPGDPNWVRAATRPAGGPWSPPADLSEPVQNNVEPHVAIDAQGNAVAVWTHHNDATLTVQAAFHPVGGGWSEPEDISVAHLAGSGDMPRAEVAMGEGGEAVAVWSRPEGDDRWVVQAASHPLGGTWSEATDISDPLRWWPWVQVGVDREGQATAVWESRDEPGYWVAQAATRPAGAAWQAPEKISAPGTNVLVTDFAVGANGETAAAWQRQDAHSRTAVEARVRPAGEAAWGPIVEVSGLDTNAPAPRACYQAFDQQVSVDPAGNVTAVWTCMLVSPIIDFVVQTRTHRAGAPGWESRRDLSAQPGVQVLAPSVAGGGDGSAVVAWRRFIGDRGTIEAARRDPKTGWGEAQAISLPDASAHTPVVALDSQGDAVAAWAVRTEGGDVAQAAGYDAGGPQLRDLVVPDAGTAGRPLAFSVSPVDVWSAPSSVRWEFGDDTGAAGSSVRHVYRRAATYQVTVTATDALGNATSATRSIEVSWPSWREAHAVPKP